MSEVTCDTKDKGKGRDEEKSILSLDRREFLTGTAALLATAVTGIGLSECVRAAEESKEARYYEKLENEEVRCLLCPKRCIVGDRERGYCGVRENRKGTYYTLVYAEPCAIHIDPVEKKPFFHVLPGSKALSFSTVGCNMECKFCQNWQISQTRPEQAYSVHTPPEAIVNSAVRTGASSIAYTYGEPVVFIEYMEDVSRIARKRNVRNLVVTNGYLNEKPLNDLCDVVDAIKIDLKAFDEKYYHDICSAELKPVLSSIAQIFKRGVWLEIVYLMVPTLNDDMKLIRDMAKWLLDNTADHVPVHFSRFYPQYRLKNLPPTPVSSLETAAEILLDEGMKFVYVGNVPGNKYESTYCPKCHNKIISREGYSVKNVKIKDGRCEFCGEKIPGIWQEGRS